MKIRIVIFIFYILKLSNCIHIVDKLFEEINKDVVKYNAIAADIEWSSSINPNAGIQERSLVYLKRRITWQRNTCNKLTAIKNILNRAARRNGNLWVQNWEPLSDLIIPNSTNLDDSMKKKKWDVKHMVKRTEDFYLSLGLPSMTNAFWRKSIFVKEDNQIRCHGTAANMFKEDDYRLLYCAGIFFHDFNVLHHEMGHIHYYMAYANQPGIFRQANSAFHESIGDAITIGVMTPQYLNRLGLINDSTLYSTNEGLTQAVPNASNKEKDIFSPIDSIKSDTNKRMNATTDEILLLKRALNKLPQIPFSLLIDEYRWRYFENNIDEGNMNKEYWAMSLEIQGISPPEERNEEFFDLGAIYHVADNTPYIRKFMSRGNSQHWREILKETFHEDDISAAALLRYYRPLEDFLIKLVEEYNIPLGW
ncbi:Angiotensin-converting enzyme [Papilio machaon]|uniref:Angiotensin-converting enzyme n=1 Tax=Papilio machaon TaxID=76193 RepID=A0A194R0B3_PAPMA|nr:Angiotensin-converting enzyme [Papilio machaon]